MNLKGLSLILCVIFASVYLTFYTFFEYMSFSVPLGNDTLEQAVSSPAEAIDENKTDNSQNNDNTISSAASSSVGSVSVSNPADAIGKITEKAVSPYSANTKYGSVYLKNNIGTKIDIKSLLNKKLSFKIKKNAEPQVLIIHTHTTETYLSEDRDYYTESDESRTRDSTKNMIAVGKVVEAKLKSAGIGVIHDTAVHDYPSYSGSYTRSAATVKSDLNAYPSVKIVIDIHRDAITSTADKSKIKPTVTINNKKCAQVMLVMGSQTGGITGYPNWMENLSLAVKYQERMEKMYPSLARSITLNSAKYNQNLSKGYLLLEVGSDANTLEEAKNGAEMAAEALVSLLDTLN